MVGLLPGVAAMRRSLAAIGYVEVSVEIDGLRLELRGHEFRYSDLAGWPLVPQVEGEALRSLYVVRGLGPAFREGFAWRRVLASYVHLHFASAPAFAGVLVERAAAYREARG